MIKRILLLFPLFILLTASYNAYSVISSSTGLRVERALVTSTCSSSPCTIASGNTGGWLTSIVRNSSGNYTLNFATGTFSATPSCSFWNFTANRYMISAGSAASSSHIFQSSDAADTTFSVLCVGQR